MTASIARIVAIVRVAQQCFCSFSKQLLKGYLLLILNIYLFENIKTEGFYNIFTIIGIIEHKIIGENQLIS